MILAWAISLAALSVDPCALASQECRAEVNDALLTYEAQLEVCDIRLDALESRLAARTATAPLHLADIPAPSPDAPIRLVLSLIAGSVGLALGLVLGVLVAH